MSEKKMEFLTSLRVENYLANTLVDEEIDNDYKKKINEFLNQYLFQDLFACEYIDAKKFVLTIEDGEDMILDSIVLYEATTKQVIEMAMSEEGYPEEQLKRTLDNRSEDQIVEDLKNGNTLDGLLNTRDCLELYLENGDDEATREQARQSLKYLYKAIKLRCDELIAAEKAVKEILCNC
ncbi:hypothetical protein BJV38_003293 [Clostridium beijerinckii]|uniref:hypothetical protein n=1 Tax=Clostridium beijerinckii TaxID=1520 RepID=UPI00156D5AF0|nr:hypothetical protein [Clostridium beijerinckii]NRT34121.1 hypothetical protein [Clostridium beijerinckii]NRT46450.1 hypothetical protein [Clostridium beijerinckii]NRZ19546.1 hypothetical protein [Clostridium beijerinckii]